MHGLRKSLLGSEHGPPTLPTGRRRIAGNSGTGGYDYGYGGDSYDETVDPEEQQLLQRRFKMPTWTLDRGAGYYARERVKNKKASLLETGRHAGRSRVKMVGLSYKAMLSHMIKRDFFSTAVDASFFLIVGIYLFVYFTTLFTWASFYYFTWRISPQCFLGFNSFSSAFLFSIETQNTIGYGVRAPASSCWTPAWLVAMHSALATLLDAVILGIMFARISHPKQRGRTLLISDSAVIARRDGVLKFMLRIADMKARQVMHPSVRITMYTWGEGRRTAEGEHIPTHIADLPVDYHDPSLLLPVVIESSIDERSPLYGHTAQTLEAAGAEIIVIFEGCTELGDMFTCRQSYLASEIHWGHTFVKVIYPARQGETQHVVNISRFHEVEPQPGLDLLRPHQLSRKVVAGGANTVPGHVLTENTLCLSDDLCVTQRDGRTYLMARVGDSFPGQNLDIQVRGYIYRWSPTVTAEGEVLPFSVTELDLTPTKLNLRYPLVVVHEVDEDSPLAKWATQQGMRMDADAEVMLELQGTMYTTGRKVCKTKVYGVLGDIKWGYHFLPIVAPPGHGSKAGGAVVKWDLFHAIAPMPTGYHAPASTSSAPSSPRHSHAGGTAPLPTTQAHAQPFPTSQAQPHQPPRRNLSTSHLPPQSQQQQQQQTPASPSRTHRDAPLPSAAAVAGTAAAVAHSALSMQLQPPLQQQPPSLALNQSPHLHQPVTAAPHTGHASHVPPHPPHHHMHSAYLDEPQRSAPELHTHQPFHRHPTSRLPLPTAAAAGTGVSSSNGRPPLPPAPLLSHTATSIPAAAAATIPGMSQHSAPTLSSTTMQPLTSLPSPISTSQSSLPIPGASKNAQPSQPSPQPGRRATGSPKHSASFNSRPTTDDARNSAFLATRSSSGEIRQPSDDKAQLPSSSSALSLSLDPPSNVVMGCTPTLAVARTRVPSNEDVVGSFAEFFALGGSGSSVTRPGHANHPPSSLRPKSSSSIPARTTPPAGGGEAAALRGASGRSSPEMVASRHSASGPMHDRAASSDGRARLAAASNAPATTTGSTATAAGVAGQQGGGGYLTEQHGSSGSSGLGRPQGSDGPWGGTSSAGRQQQAAGFEPLHQNFPFMHRVPSMQRVPSVPGQMFNYGASTGGNDGAKSAADYAGSDSINATAGGNTAGSVSGGTAAAAQGRRGGGFGSGSGSGCGGGLAYGAGSSSSGGDTLGTDGRPLRAPRGSYAQALGAEGLDQRDKGRLDLPWQETRSLFAALENMEQLRREEVAERQRQQQATFTSEQTENGRMEDEQLHVARVEDAQSGLLLGGVGQAVAFEHSDADQTDGEEVEGSIASLNSITDEGLEGLSMDEKEGDGEVEEKDESEA